MGLYRLALASLILGLTQVVATIDLPAGVSLQQSKLELPWLSTTPNSNLERGDRQSASSVLPYAAVEGVAHPAVVTVYVGRGVGSGSVLEPQGLVVTNSHVVQRAQNGRVIVKAAQGERFVGRVVAIDKPNDLALLQLELSRSLPSIPLANSNDIQMGQRVFAVGSPFGTSGVVTEGRLLRVLGNGDLQSTVTLRPGNSGGPLLNAQGKMIGVNKGVLRSRRDDRSDISYSTNVAAVKALVQQYRSGTSFPNSETLTPEDSRTLPY